MITLVDNTHIEISLLHSNEPSNINNNTDSPTANYQSTEALLAAVASLATLTIPIATSTNKHKNYNNKHNIDNNTTNSPATNYLSTEAPSASDTSLATLTIPITTTSSSNKYNNLVIQRREAEIGLKTSSNNHDSFVESQRKKQRDSVANILENSHNANKKLFEKNPMVNTLETLHNLNNIANAANPTIVSKDKSMSHNSKEKVIESIELELDDTDSIINNKSSKARCLKQAFINITQKDNRVSYNLSQKLPTYSFQDIESIYKYLESWISLYNKLGSAKCLIEESRLHMLYNLSRPFVALAVTYVPKYKEDNK
ncbi:317_t:CDS:2, partial [Racocetra persica]